MAALTGAGTVAADDVAEEVCLAPEERGVGKLPLVRIHLAKSLYNEFYPY